MLFSSTVFVFAFLPIVLLLYLALRTTALRNALLLVASLFFYAWGETGYVAVLLASIGANYGFGLWIARGERGSGTRRRALVVAVASNLLLLGAFKYANFAADTLGRVLAAAGLDGPQLAPIHLPIGISFFTFQALTYVVDVYRHDAPVQRNLFRVALYISLFPQLVAGPIVRYAQIAAALGERRSSLEDVAAGVQRFCIGLGKKVLIANTLAVPADAIFALPPSELQPAVAWLGALCYALQIYYDFSGYSDMAIGLGRIFGFRFPENFLYPYTSASVREFWRRWHVTLSSWFRDYVYIPLGGSRGSGLSTYGNLLAVFLLCGLWHGASFTFVVWGLVHGALIVAERAGGDTVLAKLPAAVRIAYTLLAVTLAWVFFRADNLPHAMGYLAAMWTPAGDASVASPLALFLNPLVGFALAAAALGSTPWLRALEERLGDGPAHAAFRWGRVAAVNVVLVACATALASGTHNPFIYFRF